MSGAWNGEYAYGHVARRVPFIAILNQDGKLLSGTIEEPNTFGDKTAPDLRATIAGERIGSYITFRKTYDGTGGQRHTVDYSGEINTSETRIDGLWRIGALTGPFFMIRETPRADEAGEGAAEAGF